jgi:tetraacyldisaccharide 4'-kinase
MRAGLENWLLRQWYTTRHPPWYLRLAEPVYSAVFQHLRKKGLSASQRYRSKIPLIVVGNITTGGSGKTPLVIRLCQIALEMNLRPGIVSKGYGRQSSESLIVKADSDCKSCGDEPVLLAIRTGVPVAVSRLRSDAIGTLNEMDLDLIISDDGLQQSDLDRDMEFCVIDGARGLGNGHLLPAGPLREPATRLGQVDYIVSNGEWHEAPANADIILMTLEANKVCSLDDTKAIPLEQFRQMHSGMPINAIAGIGHPQRFFQMLEKHKITTNPHAFPDHHQFTQKDFDSIKPGSAIIMTEKDAVKCRSLGLENAWYVPVETRLPDEFENDFKQRLGMLIKETR